MSPIKVELPQEEGKPPKHTNFRRMLLTKCQLEFEKNEKNSETLKKMKVDIKKAASVSLLPFSLLARVRVLKDMLSPV